MGTIKWAFGILLVIILALPALAQDQTLLLRDPALSNNNIAFVYAGDIWVADRDGANPRRLTSSPADEINPVFSPDGATIAYTANFENNQDVYIIPAAGGQPTRLTWHPGVDTVLDWTPDGSAVAFASARERNHGRSAQLYHVSVDGGLPEKQMEARIFRGSYDDAGRQFAYIPFGPAYNGLYGGSSGWRGYRGGTTPSVMIMDVDGDSAVEIPGERVNDIEPMAMGGQIYFISDRDGKILNIHRYDPASRQITKLTNESVWDVRAADARNGTIIYEAGGRLKQLDVASGNVSEIRISIAPDLPQLQPGWKDAGKTLQAFDLSPSGKRVAVTARGEVFTVPVKDGSTRNLSRTDGAREYTALWSPDGQSVAYIDADEETQYLVIDDQTGMGDARRFELGDNFHFLLEWGGEGQRIIYQNQLQELHAINVKSGDRTHISTGSYRSQIEADTSPDGRWLAYTEVQANLNRALKLYDFDSGQSYPVADAMADASSPAFDPDGKYLFFAASTNAGPQQVGLDMSSQERPYRAAIYAAVLAADGESPLKPKAGDEEAKKDEDKNDEKGEDEEAEASSVDPDGLPGRIVALPVSERNYGNLSVARDGTLYYIQFVQPGTQNTPPGQQPQAENELIRFKFDDQETKSLMTGVTALAISNNGDHMIVQKTDNSLLVGEISAALELKPLKMGDVRMMVDPRAEWNLIFDETWLMEKYYFYDPNMHGLDWDAIYERYKPLVAHVGRREDLTALIGEMIGEMQVGHNRSGGGDIHREDGTNTGLLGVDLRLNNGRHQIARIYTGEDWNPFLNGPLAAPGLGISEGDYILAVNGRELGENDNIFQYLQGTSGKQVTLTVSASANGGNSRDVVVEPTGNENGMRLWAWVETNRKAVAEATDGRVGYVYLPNTAGAGYTFFNRMFFPQIDKDAMIVDERSNGGGQAANYITDVLSRTYLSGWRDRVGLVYNTPGGAMYGPKVMLIDQDAGSGGDFLPYSFRHMEIGPLIGKRTWGGLIGIFANPLLTDGAFVSVPNFRYFDPNYQWTIENEGVAPDIDVALDPVATNNGRDTQLERAIQEVTEMLRTNPSPVPSEAPDYPTELGK